MKKLIFTAALFLGLSQLGKAQNSLTMELGRGICVDEIIAYYTDSEKEVFAMGCEGTYKFSTAEHKVDHLSINGVDVYIGEAVDLPVTVKGKTFTSNTKVVNVGNSIVDDLNGLIR